MLLYPKLLEEGKEQLYTRIEKNVELLQKFIGVDSLYVSMTSHFKDLFERFPDLCIINSIKENPVFGAYRGLRKLRGNDVLMVDGGISLSREEITKFLGGLHVKVGLIKKKWAGIALIKMRDLDYVIKSLERNFERSILDAFYTLKNTYSILTDFVQLEAQLQRDLKSA